MPYSISCGNHPQTRFYPSAENSETSFLQMDSQERIFYAKLANGGPMTVQEQIDEACPPYSARQRPFVSS